MYNSNYKRTQHVSDIFYNSGVTECELFDHLSIPGATAKAVLSAMLYGKCSSRIVSPLVIAVDNMTVLANIIQSQYGYKWETLYNTLNLDYNPIENYSMTETETKAGERENDKSGSNTGTTGNKTNSEFTDSKSIYGFNSSTPSGDNATEQTQNVESTGNNSGSYMETEKGKDSSDRVLTRSGNIGVMSTQDMIKQQREIARFNYLNEVINDIAGVISMSIW